MKAKRWVVMGIITLALVLFGIIWIQQAQKQVQDQLGIPSNNLSFSQKTRLMLALQPDCNQLTQQKTINKRTFMIMEGDSSPLVANRIQNELFPEIAVETIIKLMIYTGFDRKIIPGTYPVPDKTSIKDFFNTLSNTSNRLVLFSLLPGMRLEEIAALLPTAGLPFRKETFLQAAKHFPANNHPTGATTLEGILLAGHYQLNRDISLDSFLKGFIAHFKQLLTPKTIGILAEQGLTPSQATILASMVTREAMEESEYPLIASVFLNRFHAGMKFQSDPTIQYALGFSPKWGWWKAPLSAQDLWIQSPYNTYMVDGFPPEPISNFSIAAWNAMVNAPKTNYYYFQLKCDGTPFHQFSTTYEEHLTYVCSR